MVGCYKIYLLWLTLSKQRTTEQAYNITATLIHSQTFPYKAPKGSTARAGSELTGCHPGSGSPQIDSELSVRDYIQPALHPLCLPLVSVSKLGSAYDHKRKMKYDSRCCLSKGVSDCQLKWFKPQKNPCPFNIQNESSSHQTSMLNKQRFPLTCTSVHLFLKSSVTLL